MFLHRHKSIKILIVVPTILLKLQWIPGTPRNIRHNSSSSNNKNNNRMIAKQDSSPRRKSVKKSLNITSN